VVRVPDAGVCKRQLKTPRVRPGVFRAANSAPLAHVDDQPDICPAQRIEEPLERPAVDTNRRDRTH
jgi:hypothetical protein